MAAPWKRADIGGVALQLADASRAIAAARLAVNSGAGPEIVTRHLVTAQRAATLAGIAAADAIREAPPDE